MKPSPKYKTAILIDDNNIDNFINGQILSSSAFSQKKFIATNGQVALDLIHNLISGNETGEPTYPDILFVDLNMPVMDGLEFIREFQQIQNDHLKKCKIVVLTSSIHDADRNAIQKIDNAIVFMNKPLTAEMLEIL